MPEELFSVVVYDDEGFWRHASRGMTAKEAVELSKVYVDLTTTPLGANTHRIMITDADDFTVFLWERGKGVLFPSEELMDTAKAIREGK